MVPRNGLQAHFSDLTYTLMVIIQPTIQDMHLELVQIHPYGIQVLMSIGFIPSKTQPGLKEWL